MAVVQFSDLVGRIRGVLAFQEAGRLTESELWQRYVRDRDEIAFETLVHRHGPMVLSVCRRILRHEEDAEDAFQATFLVLARRAASLRSPATIANWLHGVALRTSLEARSATARRRKKEAMVLPRTVMSENQLAELWPVLDEELARLPEQYRVAVVHCDLEGKTRKETARQLGWVEGTVASRLARGRTILAMRLARRGFTVASVAVALDQSAFASIIPTELIHIAVTTALSSPALGTPASICISPRVLAITQGVLKSMFLTKVRSAVAALLIVGVSALGTAGLISRSLAIEPADDKPGTTEKTDNSRSRVAELKQQLQELQKKIAQLDQDTQAKGKENKTPVSALADRFKHKIAFEIGETETKEGGHIEIREVWGTRSKIEVGGQYLVRGRYKLPPGQRGKLYLYVTAEDAWGQSGATLDLQHTTLDNPEGEFTLVHGLAGRGYFHLYLAEPDHYSRMFANVYFGTGDNVWRKKP